MPLYEIWQGFSAELDKLIPGFEDFAASKGPSITSADFVMADECLLEGLLSRSWQAWCSFCRECVVSSCLGTTDGNGIVVAAHADAHSEAHVSAAWIKVKKSPATSPWGGTNSLLRNEPTWGDTDLLAKGLPRMSLSNGGQLLAAFSSGHASAKEVQLIRNAAAHNNIETMAEVVARMSKYLAYPISHPTHALYWIEPASNEYLILVALEELRDASLAAIS